MNEVTPRLSLPGRARAGEILEVRTLISHPMLSGLTRDDRGTPIPRNIIARFEARFEGELVFAADFDTAVAANPFLQFYMRVSRSGELICRWIEDTGQVYAAAARLEIS